MAEKKTNTQNPLANDSWFDLVAEEDQGDLKAKQWMTERRESDDESSFGNLHYGSETEQDNLRANRSQKETTPVHSHLDGINGIAIAPEDNAEHTAATTQVVTTLRRRSSVPDESPYSAQALSSGASASSAGDPGATDPLVTENVSFPQTEHIQASVRKQTSEEPSDRSNYATNENQAVSQETKETSANMATNGTAQQTKADPESQEVTPDVEDNSINHGPSAVDDQNVVEQFDLPDGGTIVSSEDGSTVVRGEIVAEGDTGSSVDHWTFHHNGGPLTIDTLSESGNNFTDIDGDGVKDHIDTMMRLYDSDGNQIAMSDDSNSGTEDGSTNDYYSHNQDSFLQLDDLPPGDYSLSIGSWELTAQEVIDDHNDNYDQGFNYNHAQDTGPYQITLTGDVSFSSDGPLATDEDTSLTISAETLLANDTDVDGDTLSITAVSEDVVDAEGNVVGTATQNDDGNIVFTPGDGLDTLAEGENKDVSFTYTVSDGQGGTDTATATVNVAGTNDQALITGSGDSVMEDATQAVNGQLSIVDVDAGEASFSPSDQSTAYGSFSLQADGRWSYRLNNNAASVQGLNEGTTVTDTISVTSTDGTNHTLVMTVTGTNDAPVIGAITEQHAEEDGSTISGSISAGDVDSAANLSFTAQETDGLVFNQDGTWSFDPSHSSYQSLAAGEAQVLSIPVTVSDGMTTDTQNLVISVTGTNDTPQISGAVTLPGGTEDTSQRITADQLLANGSDIDSTDTLSVAHVSVDPAQGIISENSDGSFIFTPNPNFNGQVSIKYDVTDGHGGTTPATAAIDIEAVNDAPVALDDLQAPISHALPDGGTIVSSENGSTIVRGEIVAEGDTGSSVDHWTFHHNGGPLTIDTLSESGNNFTDIDGDGVKDHIDTMMRLYDSDGMQVAVNDDSNSGTADGSTNDYYSHNQDSFLQLDNLPPGDYSLSIGSWELTAQEVIDDHNDNYDQGFNYNHAQDTGPYQVTLTGDVSFSSDGPLATDEDTSLTISAETLLANDTDVDGDTLSITAVSEDVVDAEGNVVGIATQDDDGNIVFTPGDGLDTLAEGEDKDVSFTYTVSDGQGGTDTATATVNVVGTNDRPELDLGSNTVITESFENFRDKQGWHIEYGEGPDSTVTGDHGTEWSLGDQGLEIQRGNIGGSQASDGASHIELDTNNNTSFSTTVDLIEGETYNLSFSYKPRPNHEDSSDMQVTLGDKELTIESNESGHLTLTSSDGVAYQVTEGEDGWQTISLDYTDLGGESAVLTFTGTGKSDSLGAYVDNIQLSYSQDDTDYAARYEENGDGVAIVGEDIQISDIDSAELTSATITLTNTKADDKLEVTELPADISAETSLDDSGNITITLTGKTGHADYQQALQSITFSNSSDAPDESDRTISITVNDGQGGTNTAMTTIAVESQDDGISLPFDINTQSNTITEHAAEGSEVHITAQAIDPDSENNITYSLIDENGNTLVDGAFAINAQTGVVTVNDRDKIDYETTSNKQITVRATGEDGSFGDSTFDIAIKDASLIKTTDLGGDPEGTPITFSLTGDHFDPNNTDDVGAGSPKYQIQVNGSPIEIDGNDTFTVEANRGYIRESEQDLTGDGQNDQIVVRNGNDFEQVTFRVPEGTDIDSVAIKFINDAWDGGQLNRDGDNTLGEDRNLVVRELNIGGEVQDDGSILGGTTLQAEDEEVSQYIRSDGADVSGRETMAWKGTMTFYPDGVNHTPDAGDDTGLSLGTDEDTALTIDADTLLANDTDVDGDTLSITAVSEDVVDAEGNVVGTATQDDDGNIVFTPGDGLDTLAEGESKDVSFTYTVSDGQGGTDTATATVNVAGKDNDLTYVSESAGYRNVVGIYETDTDGNPTSGTVVIDDQNGMAGGTHLADLEPGNHEFFIIANGAGEIDNESVITFDTSGDMPVLLIDGQPANHPVYFTEPGFNPDGADHFIFESDGEGGTTIKIEDLPNLGDRDFGDVVLHTDFAMDDRTAVGSVSDDDQTANMVEENSAGGTYTGITAEADDADGDVVSYSLSDDAHGRFTIDSETGRVTVAEGADLDYEKAASHTITVDATSSDGTSSNQEYTIKVTDLDDTPPAPPTIDLATSSDTGDDHTDNVTTDHNPLLTGTAEPDSTVTLYADGQEVGTAVTDADGNWSYNYEEKGLSLLDRPITTKSEADINPGDSNMSEHNNTRDNAVEFTREEFGAFRENFGTDDADSDTDGHEIPDNVKNPNSLSARFVGEINNTHAEGTHTEAVDADWVKVSLKAGEKLTLDVDYGADGNIWTTEGSVDTELRVFDNHGNMVQDTESHAYHYNNQTTDARQDDDLVADGGLEGGDGSVLYDTSGADARTLDPYYEFTAPEDGEYYVQVTAYNNGSKYDSGTYELWMSIENPQVEFTATATDESGNVSDPTDPLIVTIDTAAILEEEQTPVGQVTDRDALANEVDENSADGTYTGITAKAEDADGDTVSYSLSDDADGRFTIDSKTGRVTVAEGADLDFENATSHNITVEAASDDGSTSSQQYTVNVSDVDDTASTPVAAISVGDPTIHTVTVVDTEATAAQGITQGEDGKYYQTETQENTIQTETAKLMKTEEISVGRADTIRMDEAPEYGVMEIRNEDGTWSEMQIGQEYSAESEVRFNPDEEAIGDGTRDINIGTFGKNTGTSQFTERVELSDWGEVSDDGKSVVYEEGDLRVTTTSSDGALTAYNTSGTWIGAGIGDNDNAGLDQNETLHIAIEGEEVNQVTFTVDGLAGYFDKSSSHATQVQITAYDSDGNVIDVQGGYRESGQFADEYSFTTNVPVASFELGTTGSDGNYVVQNMTLSKTVSDDVTFTATYPGGDEVSLTSNLNIEQENLDQTQDMSDLIPAAEEDITREVEVIDTEAMAAKGAFQTEDGTWVVETTQIQEVLVETEPPTMEVTQSVEYDVDIKAALTDQDGSEHLSLTLTDVPEGAVFDKGTNNGDGTWTIEVDKNAVSAKESLVMTTPQPVDGAEIELTATATEDSGDTVTIRATSSIPLFETEDAEALLTPKTLTVKQQPMRVALIDGAVEGIEYTTNSGIHGFTDANGEFLVNQDDEVTFNVGGVTLGTATAEDLATGQTFLQDIADVHRTDLNDEYTENMATFLQSLDENSDAYDGIVITDEIREALADADIDLRTASEEDVQKLVESVGKTYVNENDAMEHVEDMLVDHTDLNHDDFSDHIDDNLNDTLTTGNRRDNFISSLPDDSASISALHEQDNFTMEIEVPSIDLDSSSALQVDNGEQEHLPVQETTQTVQTESGQLQTDTASDTLVTVGSETVNQSDLLSVGDLLSDELPSTALQNDQAIDDQLGPQDERFGDLGSENGDKDTSHGDATIAQTTTADDSLDRSTSSVHTVATETSDAMDDETASSESTTETETSSAATSIEDPQETANGVEDDLSTVGETPSIALTDDTTATESVETGGEGNNPLEAFDVTNGAGAEDTGSEGTIDQFMVSDTNPSMEEIPPMDGLDAIPEADAPPEPDDAGLGVDDAATPEEVHDPAPAQEEAIAA